MRIGIYSKKGGVGKTPLSFLISKELDLPIATNDDGDLDLFERTIKKPTSELAKIKGDCVFDLGGWLAVEVLDVLKTCDLIIVPHTPNNISSAIKTPALIRELSENGLQTINILTMYENNKELEKIKNDTDSEIEFDFYFPKTKLLRDMTLEDKTMEQLMEDKTKRNWYENHSLIFKQFIDELKGIKNVSK